MFGTLVWSLSFTAIFPRPAREMPTVSSPNPSLHGRRPVATRTVSTSSVFPPESVSVSEPSALSRRSSTFVPRWSAIFCFFISRSSDAEISSSSAITSRGSISMTVVCVPIAAKKQANSHPITPPPRMATRFGCFVRSSASLLPMTRSPSSDQPGGFRSDRGEEAGELAPDHPAAQDGDALRLLREIERLLAADDALAVERPAGRIPCVGPGGEDHVVGGELLAPALLLRHRDAIRGREPGGALVNVHLAAGQELLHAARQLFHDLVLPRHQRRPVDLRLADDDAVLAGALDLLEKVRGHDPRLGRDASPVEARAAQLVLLDDGGLQAHLRGTDRGHVAAGSGADDDDVVMRHGGTPSGAELRHVGTGPKPGGKVRSVPATLDERMAFGNPRDSPRPPGPLESRPCDAWPSSPALPLPAGSSPGSRPRCPSGWRQRSTPGSSPTRSRRRARPRWTSGSSTGRTSRAPRRPASSRAGSRMATSASGCSTRLPNSCRERPTGRS